MGLWYIECGDGTFRVGRNDWANDMFNIYVRERFAIIEEACEMMSIPLRNITYED